MNDKIVDDRFSSPEYTAQDAASKKDALWEQITADKTSGSFPGIKLPGLFFEAMDPTFKTPGDVMPREGLGGLRTKYIHSVGVVGKVKFVSAGNHPFNGLWKGADHGLIRLSAAVQPTENQCLAPGIALKFLRDGQEAADLVAMYGVNGTPGDWNFFEKDFSNHIPYGTGAEMKALFAKFATETPWI